MRLTDFDYDLPEELIAQTPLEKRSASRLLVLDKKTGAIEHRHFYDIVDLLNAGDYLVINDTKVIPARIYGIKLDTQAVIEVLLLKETEPNTWQVLTRPAKRVKVGTKLSFGEGLLIAECTAGGEDGERVLKFTYTGIFLEILEHIGTMPLPPYIKEKLQDQSRYQTVYAENYGSSAAPTAGLHFTPELLMQLKQKGVTILHVTLHVGLGTFRPVMEENIEQHHMHTESYYISTEVAEKLNEAKRNHQRIVSVGTTSTRVLEANYRKFQEFHSEHAETDIFIYPPYQFQAVDALITNFHLPKSTLIMLVSALSTRENILAAYRVAVAERYRFFSFGDAMFIH